MTATHTLLTPPPDLQKQPRTLPLWAPKLDPIVPADIPKWRREWKAFLFGKDYPKTFTRRGLSPQPVSPTVTRGSIERLALKYTVDSGVTVDAYLLKPRALTGRRPGILLLHETQPISNPWKRAASLNHLRDENIGAHLAQRGCVVLVPRCFIFAGLKLPGIKPDFKDGDQEDEEKSSDLEGSRSNDC
jgi:hypothetical protein